MKKILLSAIFIAATITSYSQALNYDNLALLFSSDNQNGSARFNAMSGAFGALGGDISSLSVNPAGAAVFKTSAFSVSGSSRETDITSNFYGNSLTTQNEYFNINQAGAVLVFDNYEDSDWDKVAFGFNYRIKNNFDNTFAAEGNSGVATFVEFLPDTKDPRTQYNVAENQHFSNSYSGEISEFNFAVSGTYQRKLYVGAALNTVSLQFNQQAILQETNNDGNGNRLDARLVQENITTGTGFSLSAGFIYKANKFFRLGASYETPTWYTELIKETNFSDEFGDEGFETVSVTNDNRLFRNNNPFEILTYKLKTPSRITLSGALIFGKNGLLSVDYSRKGYQKINLSNADFSDVNPFFTNNLRNTTTLNVGTEWRLDKLSLRGGYRYEQNPRKDAIESDDLKGYSFGVGYNFGNTKFDIGYSDRNKTSFYDVYPQYNNINTVDLKTDNKIITATLTFNL